METQAKPESIIVTIKFLSLFLLALALHSVALVLKGKIDEVK